MLPHHQQKNYGDKIIFVCAMRATDICDEKDKVDKNGQVDSTNHVGFKL